MSRQKDACLALAKARGWTVVATYTDNSVSATKGGRPEWDRMLGDARGGRFDIVVAWAADRLIRRLSDLETLIATGVRAATVQGDLDLTTPQGELTATMLAAVARAEVRQKGERQRLANAQRRAAGKPPTGPPPLGYEKDGVTPSAAAPVVREAFEALIEGRSIRAIARQLNAQGHLTYRGNAWMPYSVRNLLTNPRYAGLQPDGSTPGAWEPIVSEETWHAAKAILADPDRKTTPAGWGNRKYLLSGLATCGLCGAWIVAGGTPRTQPTYKCSAKPHLQRVSPPIDAFIEELVVARLSRPDAAELFVPDRPDTEPLRREARTLRARLDSLATDFADGELTASQLRVASTRLTTKLREVEAALASAGRKTTLGAFAGVPTVREAWAAMDLEGRRAVVDTLLSIELLSPGMGTRRFDPATVNVQWKSPR